MVILLNVLGYLGILIIIFNSSFMFFYSCFQCSVGLTIISKIRSRTFNFISLSFGFGNSYCNVRVGWNETRIFSCCNVLVILSVTPFIYGRTT
jgi:hypothetical protein